MACVYQHYLLTIPFSLIVCTVLLHLKANMLLRNRKEHSKNCQIYKITIYSNTLLTIFPLRLATSSHITPTNGLQHDSPEPRITVDGRKQDGIAAVSLYR